MRVNAACFLVLFVGCSSSGSSGGAAPDGGGGGGGIGGNLGQDGGGTGSDGGGVAADGAVDTPITSTTGAGSFDGRTFNGKEAASWDNSDKSTSFEIWVTDYAGTCALRAAYDSHKATSIRISFALADHSHAPLQAGVYHKSVGPATGPASGTFLSRFDVISNDASCIDHINESPDATVTLKTVSPTLTGSFTTTTGLSGTFVAPLCNRSSLDLDAGVCQ